MRLGVSQRRACALMGTARSSLWYESKMKRRDRRLRRKLRAIARRRNRWGYRFATATLRRRGEVINPKRVYRVWRNEGLAVPRKRGYKRIRGAAPRPLAPCGANEVWAWDFVHDRCANGQKLKILTLVDEHTRYCLALEVAARMPSRRVIEVIGRVMADHGAPKYLRSDNGPEFVAKALRRWMKQHGIETAYIDPGKPWQNGTNESFNGTLRDDCLNAEWFLNGTDARYRIERWRKHYNEERPHSSLGYGTPEEAWLASSESPTSSEPEAMAV
jgi:putative transposase